MLTVDYHLINIRDGECVLDAGCGEGRHTYQACQQARCTVCALDIEQDNLAKIKYMMNMMESEKTSGPKWVALRGDTLQLPFRDMLFDKIICSEVLEHVASDINAIQELKRVLKDTGILAISVPTYLSESIYWKISPGYHHVQPS